ncbi:MAG: cupin domain-containing protein [Thermoleophilaceae bacterium]
MSKLEAEFFAADTVGWTPVAGDAELLYERILAPDGDGGVATRMLWFQPGADTSPNGMQVHDFWEEVYILEGAIHDIQLGRTFTAGMYACRPPGMEHGPWRSPEGCKTFEVRYRR